jgi:hypothetical protein
MGETAIAPDPRAGQTPSALAPPCRICASPLQTTLVDLGMSPLCESFVPPAALDSGEAFYPLHVRICDTCLLAQLEEYVPAKAIFEDGYVYFSSYSTSWVEHARRYAETMTAQLALGATDLVVEIGSNDGYLLQHFVAAGILALGIDPVPGAAALARKAGVQTLVEFFDDRLAKRLARRRGHAKLLVANNVLAQVPALNDFVDGMRTLLAADGVATVEVPHLMQLIDQLEFDTIYHEHYSYFSLYTLVGLFERHGLQVFDVEELPTHGGSLRVFVRHDTGGDPQPAVEALLEREREAGYHDVAGYRGFAERVVEVRWAILELLLALRREGRSVAAYGAPGKGNTLLNYCGIRSDLVEYTVDRNPAKHGLFLPGSHIPIHPPERLAETRPDVIVILPWNLRDEIAAQLAYTREWGARLLVPIPHPELIG